MAQTVILDLSGYEVIETNTFSRKLKKIQKKAKSATKSIEDFKRLITRKGKDGQGIESTLRYKVDCNGLKVPVYYTRWTDGSNSGKSSGLRLWYCKFDNFMVLCLMEAYKHSQNVDDIERHTAIEYVKEAYQLVQSIPD